MTSPKLSDKSNIMTDAPTTFTVKKVKSDGNGNGKKFVKKGKNSKRSVSASGKSDPRKLSVTSLQKSSVSKENSNSNSFGQPSVTSVTNVTTMTPRYDDAAAVPSSSGETTTNRSIAGTGPGKDRGQRDCDRDAGTGPHSTSKNKFKYRKQQRFTNKKYKLKQRQSLESQAGSVKSPAAMDEADKGSIVIDDTNRRPLSSTDVDHECKVIHSRSASDSYTGHGSISNASVVVHKSNQSPPNRRQNYHRGHKHYNKEKGNHNGNDNGQGGHRRDRAQGQGKRTPSSSPSVQERDVVQSDDSYNKDECERTVNSPILTNDEELLLLHEEDQGQDIAQGKESQSSTSIMSNVTPKGGKRQSRRKPYRTKKEKAHFASQTKEAQNEVHDQDQDRVHDLAIPVLFHEPSEEVDAAVNTSQELPVVECSTQTDNPEITKLDLTEDGKGLNTEELRENVAMNRKFKTNAAGLALLNSLSRSPQNVDNPIDVSTTFSLCASDVIDDGVDSLGVNPSETSVLVDDDRMEQGHGGGLSPAPVPGHDYGYGYGYGYEASFPASSNAGTNTSPTSSTENVHSQNYEGPTSAGRHFQPQQQWMVTPQATPRDGSQEYYPNPYMNMQQPPMFIPIQPYCGDNLMPQPYTMAYGSIPYPVNAYGYPPMATAPMQQQVQPPLKYEQVTVGGTVFFNPVYETQEDTPDIEGNPMDAQDTKGDNVINTVDDTGKVAPEERKEKAKRGKNGKYGKKSKNTRYKNYNHKNNAGIQKHDTDAAVDGTR